MKIKEIFYTIQGEGKNWGMPSVFVRFGECNLRCNFCDTDFLTGLVDMTTNAVVDFILAESNGCRNIVFTGGEPLLQQQALIELIEALDKIDQWYYAVETNGTIQVLPTLYMLLDWICVSPKVKPEAIKIGHADEVKVVYTQQYRQWLPGFMKTIQADHYCISPEALPNNPYTEGKEDGYYPQNTNIKEVIQFVKENPQWRLNLQTHKILNIR